MIFKVGVERLVRVNLIFIFMNLSARMRLKSP